VLEETVHGNIAFTLLIALVSTLLAGGALAAALKGRPIAGAVLALLATIVIAGPRLVPAGTPLERGTPDPNTRYAFVNADWQLLIGLPVVHPPNTATVERKLDVAGYDSLIHRDTFKILNEINGKDSAPEANGNMALIKPGFDGSKLLQAGVSRIAYRDEDGRVVDGPYAFPSGRVADDGPLTQTKPIDGYVVSDTLTTTVVKGYGPGKLTLRDRNMPGWTATVDGQPAEIEGDRWRELELPPGNHTVVFEYSPPGLKPGLILFAIASLIVLASLNLYRLRKPR
jgi:hypothetical protein